MFVSKFKRRFGSKINIALISLSYHTSYSPQLMNSLDMTAITGLSDVDDEQLQEEILLIYLNVFRR